MVVVRGAIYYVWKVSIAAELALAVRLLYQGLAGRYPALFSASVVLPIKSLVLLNSYLLRLNQIQIKQLSENLGLLDLVFAVWIVYEVFSCWYSKYTGIGTLGKTLFAVIIAASIAVSVLFWSNEWQALDFVRDFRFYYILHRTMLLTPGLILIGMWLFFRMFPVQNPPNVMRYAVGATFYLLSGGIAELIFTLWGLKYMTEVNLAIVSITTVTFALWALVLNKAGEVVPQEKPRRPERYERTERLNQDLLDLMNRIHGDIRR